MIYLFIDRQIRLLYKFNPSLQTGLRQGLDTERFSGHHWCQLKSII